MSAWVKSGQPGFEAENTAIRCLRVHDVGDRGRGSPEGVRFIKCQKLVSVEFEPVSS
jgi:hypothetical protein